MAIFSVISLHGWVDVETLHAQTGINRSDIAAVMRVLDAIEKEAEAAWVSYYHLLPNLIKKFGLKRGCEIGVSTGGHSYQILGTTDVEKLYSIDPYNSNTTLHLWGHENYSYEIMFHRVKHRLAQFGRRSEFSRCGSSF